MAIRYLGGLLELSTFWSNDQYPVQRYAATRLFSRTIELIEDLGMENESPGLETDNHGVTSDLEGLDILCTSILVGTETWISRLGTSMVAEEYWCEPFVQFLLQFNRCGESSE